MVQFKDVFLGTDKRPPVRAASAQACLRAAASTTTWRTWATPRATTPSSRCWGNFSFGDYFKRDAIRWGWELLTGRSTACRPSALVTVYDETTRPSTSGPSHRRRAAPSASCASATTTRARSTRDNFWRWRHRPCGPCSRSSTTTAPDPGGPPGSPDEGRRPLHRDLEPRVHAVRDAPASPAARPCVDTGMGLERLPPPSRSTCTATTRSTCSSA